MKTLVLINVLCMGLLAGCVKMTFIDFEDFYYRDPSTSSLIKVSVGDSFYVGDILIENSSDTEIVVLPFRWLNDTPTNKGHIRIDNSGRAGGTKQEIQFNNACLGIVSQNNETISNMKFKFGDHGGNINLIVDGTLYNELHFEKISSPIAGGIHLNVTGGHPLGIIEFKGHMLPFYYVFPEQYQIPDRKYSAIIGGGQELWIDDLEFYK